MKKLILPIWATLIIIAGCDDQSSNSPKITSSQAVQGTTATMNACKQKLLKTAEKYNVSFSVSIEEDDYVSARLIKNGIKTDLLATCEKTGNTYLAMFEIPDEMPEDSAKEKADISGASEEKCIQLRNEWNKLQSSYDEKDWKKSEQYLADYKSAGCIEKCGRMVEDTDTPEKETWCN